MDSQDIRTPHLDVFSSQAIEGNGDVTSAVIDLASFKPVGNFSIHLYTVGAGSTVKLEYLLSNFDQSITAAFQTPNGATDIITAHAAGYGFYDFAPETGLFLKIKATETAGNAVTSMDLKLAIQ